MKPSPIIIVSTMNEKKGAEFGDWSTSLSHWYTRAIAKAGGVPLLAICRGPQVLNVALGGGLVTDIPTERPEAMKHQIKGKAHKLAHNIEIKSGTLMRQIFRRASIRINSAHHQAVGELAPMLRATAWTRDGIVEAIELVQKDAVGAPFLLGIQFHPERLIDEHPEFLRIFKAFVKACRA